MKSTDKCREHGMKLSEPQAIALLRKHATGDFGRHRWPTIRSLFDMGLIVETPKGGIEVTSKGAEWCYENHMNHQFLG